MGLSPRGAFVIVSGVLLIAIGLAIRGIGGLIGLIQLFTTVRAVPDTRRDQTSTRAPI